MKAIMSGALILALAVGAFFLLTKRYRYFDFEASSCTPESLGATAELKGSFSQDSPTVRGAPYFLRVESNQSTISSVSRSAIVSSETGHLVSSIGVPRIEKVSGSGVVLLATGIHLPYEDVDVQLELRFDHSNAALTCHLRRKYSEELRVPLWDQLLSV